MKFINADGTTSTPAAMQLLKMAGVDPELFPMCHSIPDALGIVEGMIDGQDPEDDQMAGMMNPVRLLLITLQILAAKSAHILERDCEADDYGDALDILRSLTELNSTESN